MPAAPRRLQCVTTTAIRSTSAVAGEVQPARPDGRIRVLIADSHAVLRRVLADLLAETDDITVVGECGSGDELLPAAVRTRPDVVLVDPTLPGTDPLQAARELLDVQPGTRIAVHSRAFCLVTCHRAQRLGAAGYLLKGDDLADLPQRIRDLAGGGTAWCARAAAGGR